MRQTLQQSEASCEMMASITQKTAGWLLRLCGQGRPLEDAFRMRGLLFQGRVFTVGRSWCKSPEVGI